MGPHLVGPPGAEWAQHTQSVLANDDTPPLPRSTVMSFSTCSVGLLLPSQSKATSVGPAIELGKLYKFEPNHLMGASLKPLKFRK